MNATMAILNFGCHHKVNDWFHYLQLAVQRDRDEKSKSFSAQILAPLGASRSA
jgi:hypothetical protein